MQFLMHNLVQQMVSEHTVGELVEGIEWHATLVCNVPRGKMERRGERERERERERGGGRDIESENDGGRYIYRERDR